VLSKRFARISHHEIDNEINSWLERVCRSLDLDRSVIGEYIPDKGDFRATYQWTREGFPRGPMVAASKVIPWISAKVRAGEIVAVSDADSLPPEAECDKHFMLSPVGPKATLVMPLIIGSQVVAGITFADLHGKRRWTPQLIRKLSLVTDIFANAIARKRAEIETDRFREETRRTAHFALMGEMTAAMAHELSHPLGAIVANAQAARRMLDRPNPDLAELREALDDVIAGERRAASYIDKVRSLFKRSEPRTESLQVERVLNAAASLMRSDLPMKEIAFAIEIAPDLPTIRADRTGLEQVIINLLRNAAEAIAETKCSERRVTVRAFPLDSSRVGIAVSDTGKGVETKALGKIFQPLFTTKTNGTGMGLAIVRSIIESLGGEIQVHSEARRGSTFQFSLPADEH
jgi:signal transduction histidine kinase